MERCNSKRTQLEFLSPAGLRVESDVRKRRRSKWWQGCHAFPSLPAPMTPKSSGSRVPQGFGARGNLGMGESEVKSTSCGVHEMLSFSCAVFEGARAENSHGASTRPAGSRAWECLKANSWKALRANPYFFMVCGHSSSQRSHPTCRPLSSIPCRYQSWGQDFWGEMLLDKPLQQEKITRA